MSARSFSRADACEVGIWIAATAIGITFASPLLAMSTGVASTLILVLLRRETHHSYPDLYTRVVVLLVFGAIGLLFAHLYEAEQYSGPGKYRVSPLIPVLFYGILKWLELGPQDLTSAWKDVPKWQARLLTSLVGATALAAIVGHYSKALVFWYGLIVLGLIDCVVGLVVVYNARPRDG